QPFSQVDRHLIIDEGFIVGGNIAQVHLTVELADSDNSHAQPGENIVIIHMLDLPADGLLVEPDGLVAIRQAGQPFDAEPFAEQLVEVKPPGQVDLPGPESGQFPVNQGSHGTVRAVHGVEGSGIAPQDAGGGTRRTVLDNVIQRRLDNGNIPSAGRPLVPLPKVVDILLEARLSALRAIQETETVPPVQLMEFGKSADAVTPDIKALSGVELGEPPLKIVIGLLRGGAAR